MNTYSFLLTFFLLCPLYAPPKHKPRSASYQETTQKKAVTYTQETINLSKSYSATMNLYDQLLFFRNQLDSWLQQQTEWDNLGSIVDNRLFPQSIINALYDFEEGTISDLCLLKTTIILEFKLLATLKLAQKMLVFSTVNQLLVCFFAAKIAATPELEKHELKSTFKGFFKEVFEAQETLIHIPYIPTPKLTRSQSA